MPIMAPLSDLLGIPRQVAVLAFQFGDGLSNILWPTAFMPIICGIAKIRIDKWLRLVRAPLRPSVPHPDGVHRPGPGHQLPVDLTEDPAETPRPGPARRFGGVLAGGPSRFPPRRYNAKGPSGTSRHGGAERMPAERSQRGGTGVSLYHQADPLGAFPPRGFPAGGGTGGASPDEPHPREPGPGPAGGGGLSGQDAQEGVLHPRADPGGRDPGLSGPHCGGVRSRRPAPPSAPQRKKSAIWRSW